MAPGWAGVLAAAVLASGCGGGTPDPDPAGSVVATLSVTSSAFEPGGEIPGEFGCDGHGAFPGLTWDGVPQDTQSVAVTVLDPDAPSGTFVHALIADLPAGTAGLQDVAQLARGATLGANGASDATYLPPCPPEDDPAHEYVFTVYAVDTVTELEQGFSVDELEAALDGHVLARGEVTGTLAR